MRIAKLMRIAKRHGNWVSMILAALAFAPSAHAEAPKKAVETPKKVVAKMERHRANIDAFFSPDGPVAALSFEFAPEELAKIRKDPREYAECTMTEAGGKTYRGVGVKLKGGRSFREIDAKPGMTVNMKKYSGGERFHGMEKFHLNNAVQDATYMHEIIAAEVCRAAGVPAGRGTHALVSVGGQTRGLYVFKEAYSEEFLAHFFADPTGDLYDGGRWVELTETMEKDQGDDDERDNIKELIGACREADPATRWKRLNAILDVDAYVSFTAVEALLSHHDGYNFNHNNYRVYFDPATGKAHFVHHGMDQAFGWQLSLLKGSATLAWNAVFSNPEWHGRYRGRLQELYANAIQPTDWSARIAALGAKAQAALEKVDAKLAAEFPEKVATAQKQVKERFDFVADQLAHLPEPAAFGADGTLAVTSAWKSLKWSGADIKFDRPTFENAERLRIGTGKPGAGAWEATLNLARGRYRVEGRVKTAGVVAGAEGKNPGVSFNARTKVGARQFLKGDNDWCVIGSEFETPGADVTLQLEFRAEHGEAWLDLESVRLVRLP